jgi:hypothetical protein
MAAPPRHDISELAERYTELTSNVILAAIKSETTAREDCQCQFCKLGCWISVVYLIRLGTAHVSGVKVTTAKVNFDRSWHRILHKAVSSFL